MANSKSARKRAGQALKRRAQNVALRSRMRTSIKKVAKALGTGERAAAEGEFRAAVPVIDSMVNKGLVHRNKAARQKSRLNARLRALG